MFLISFTIYKNKTSNNFSNDMNNIGIIIKIIVKIAKIIVFNNNNISVIFQFT